MIYTSMKLILCKINDNIPHFVFEELKAKPQGFFSKGYNQGDESHQNRLKCLRVKLPLLTQWEKYQYVFTAPFKKTQFLPLYKVE